MTRSRVAGAAESWQGLHSQDEYIQACCRHRLELVLFFTDVNLQCMHMLRCCGQVQKLAGLQYTSSGCLPGSMCNITPSKASELRQWNMTGVLQKCFQTTMLLVVLVSKQQQTCIKAGLCNQVTRGSTLDEYVCAYPHTEYVRMHLEICVAAFKVPGRWHLLAKWCVQHFGHTPTQGADNIAAVLCSADDCTNDWNVFVADLDLPFCGASRGGGIHRP